MDMKALLIYFGGYCAGLAWVLIFFIPAQPWLQLTLLLVGLAGGSVALFMTKF